MRQNMMVTISIIGIVFSTASVLYIVFMRQIYINKGSLHMYENSPISYINKPVDINTTGLSQKYEFKNTVAGKYNIGIKIISESLPSHSFNGEYKISVHDSHNKLVRVFFCATNLNKEWYRINLTADWSDKLHTQYYRFGELELNCLDYYTITIENIKGLSSTGKGVYQIAVYPFEYNYAIQKKNLDRGTLIKSVPYIILFIFSIFWFVYLRK